MTRGTRLGALDGSMRADVDEHGSVRLDRSRWTVTWAVRAGDGWHHAPAARAGLLSQRRIDGTPVVETTLRIRRGQVVHRAYVARSAGGADAVVVEVENRSAAPVGVALALSGATQVDLEALVLTADRQFAVRLPREPSRASGSLAEILADGGDATWPGAIRARRRHAEAAVVFPLAHTACLRAVAGADVAADDLPDAERVAAGWVAHLASGLRLELPDPVAVEAVRADLADLLLADDLDAEAILALDRFGQRGPTERALASAIDDQTLHRDGGTLLLALAEHVRLTGGAELLEHAVGPVAAAAHRLRRQGTGAIQLAAADILDAADQPEAAGLCRGRAGSDAVAADGRDVSDRTPAGRLLALRDTLVGEGPGGVVLAPAWPDEWLGQGVEVHRAPTRWGRLSYAVRWHGARPALLWEREGADGVELRCGLDPAWTTTAAQGEALLAPVEPAGGLPKVVAPLAEPGTPVDEATAEGPGFT